MSITYKNRRKLDILKLKYNALYVALGQDIYLMTVFNRLLWLLILMNCLECNSKYVYRTTENIIIGRYNVILIHMLMTTVIHDFLVIISYEIWPWLVKMTNKITHSIINIGFDQK